MSLQDYYEDAYNRERGRVAADLLPEAITASKALANYVIESKDKFLTSKDWKGLKVLELGCGRGGVGIQLARLGADVTLVDFSPSALKQAELLFQNEGFSVKTICGDVTHPDLLIQEKYDLIVDSHLLHCLIQNPERSSYYELIRSSLSEDGIFVAETMVHRKKLFVPDGFMFDENYVLWQMFGKWMPVRRILDSLDLEQEINNSGLRITYFYYYGQFAFVPHMSFMDIPSEILPAAVRMVLKRS
ncbi:MAG: class I SAM-dependent methyltransferase [Bacteriovoracaceae bacterium]